MEAPPITPPPHREVLSTPRIHRGPHKCWTGASALLYPSTPSSETLPFMGSGSLEEALPRPTAQHPDSSLRHQDDRGPGASRLQAQATALLLIPLLSSCLCPRGTRPSAQHRLTNVCPVTKASPAPTTGINMGPAGTGSLQRCHLGCYVARQGAVPMRTHHIRLQPLNGLQCIWGFPQVPAQCISSLE